MADAKCGGNSDQHLRRSFIPGFSTRASNWSHCLSKLARRCWERERVIQVVQLKMKKGGEKSISKVHSDLRLTHLELDRPPWATNTISGNKYHTGPLPAHNDPTFTVPAHFQHSLPTQAYLLPPYPPNLGTSGEGKSQRAVIQIRERQAWYLTEAARLKLTAC